MAILASISIDVSKIDKQKLINGKKGTYLNLTVSINDQEDQFGNNVSAWQGQSKEERDAKTPKNYLGNGKKLWEGQSKSFGNAPEAKNDFTPANMQEDPDDLPF